MQKFIKTIFFFLVLASLLAPWLVSKELLFPYITTKALFFRLVIELALPLYLYLLLDNKNLRPNFKNPLTISLVAFFLISVISSFAGVNVTRSLWGNFERMGGAYYMAHLLALYFYVLMLGQMGGKYLWWFMQCVVGSAALMAVYGIFVRLQWINVLADPSFPRISATLGNPIFFASFLIFPLFLALWFGLRAENTAAKVFYWLAAFLQLIGIYLSGTRGAVVGLAVGVFVAAVLYIILTTQTRLRFYSSVLLGIFVALAAVLFVFSKNLPQGTMLRRVFNLNDSNSQSRLIQWKIALNGFKDKPVLGTGPENYYVPGNKYYDPELYLYDRSWFDKPHNYLLEILVTTGILGFLAYGAALVFAVWIIWKNYRAQILSLGEFCLLVAGLVVYQIQNLFVFDTIPASLMFFVFLGFVAYLWVELQPSRKHGDNYMVLSPIFSASVMVVSLFLVTYTIHASVVSPARISKSINYGYAYAQANIKTADGYFNNALALPFNLDPSEVVSKYSDFVVGLSVAAPKSEAVFVNERFERAITMAEDYVEKVDNEPIIWQKLSRLYLYQAIFRGTGVNVRAFEAAEAAVDLAPKRIESLILLAQLYDSTQQPQKALESLRKAGELDGSNQTIKFQIATLYEKAGEKETAKGIIEGLMVNNYKFGSLAEIMWAVNFYESQNFVGQLPKIYEQAIAFPPKNYGLYLKMAQAYAAAGDKAKAIEVAQIVIKQDPSKKQEAQDFINSLK